MSAKKEILTRIAAAKSTLVPMPDLSAFAARETEDVAARFATAVERAGGRAVFASAGADVEALITELYPAPASYTPEEGGVFVEIVDGRFGVAENGAVWIADQADRSRLFAATNLVITVPSERLVPTMHEAFARLDFGFGTFGCFIAGPSKTADIEQSLVIGAHGACGVTVVVV